MPSTVACGAAALGGRAILVTRPAAQAGTLCALIAAAGGEAVPFPTLEIISTWKSSPLCYELNSQNVIKTGVIIFVSPSAVSEGLAALSANGVSAENWPAATAVAAVGRGTAAALTRRGLAKVIAPTQGADSEALAALPEFQPAAVAGRSILIVRGEGGREWLVDALRSRGARVSVAECYRRALPKHDAESTIRPLAGRWMAGGIAALTVHSRGALDNLLLLLPVAARPAVFATPLFASHPRIAEHARALGARDVRVAGPGDAEMIAGLLAFFAKVAP